MLNQVVEVGRLTQEPQLEQKENGKKVCNIILAVPRSFKNSEGMYDTDFIKASLWDSVAENTCEYCHKGDMIGVKGRLKSTDNTLELVAEKVTFLATRKEKDNLDPEIDKKI